MENHRFYENPVHRKNEYILIMYNTRKEVVIMSWTTAVSRVQDLNPRLYTNRDSTRIYTPVNRTRMYNASRPSAVRHERKNVLPAYRNVSDNTSFVVPYAQSYDTVREQATHGDVESARLLTNLALGIS